TIVSSESRKPVVGDAAASESRIDSRTGKGYSYTADKGEYFYGAEHHAVRRRSMVEKVVWLPESAGRMAERASYAQPVPCVHRRGYESGDVTERSGIFPESLQCGPHLGSMDAEAWTHVHTRRQCSCYLERTSAP